MEPSLTVSVTFVLLTIVTPLTVILHLSFTVQIFTKLLNSSDVKFLDLNSKIRKMKVQLQILGVSNFTLLPTGLKLAILHQWTLSTYNKY